LESKKPIGEKRHYFVIFNPRSGREKKWNIESRISSFFLQRDLKCSFLHIDELANKKTLDFFNSAPESRIVVVGGDGTLRSTYSFAHFNNIKLPIAFIPLGSANISARSLGTPLNTKKALERAVHGSSKSIDCGIINEKYLFSISACFGKVAEVTIKTRDSEKKILGAKAYFKRSHVFLGNYKKHPFTIEHSQGKEHFPTAHSIMVCNHFNILGMNLKKRGIIPNDGQLDVLIAANPSFWGLFKAALDLFFRKGQTNALRQIKISDAILTGQDFDGMVHCDGELVKLDSKKIKVEIIPNCINIII